MKTDKQNCPVCGSGSYKLKKKFHELDLGFCQDCSVAYARPLIRGGGDDVGESNSTITENDFYQGIKENHETQSVLAEKKVPHMLKYWNTILTSNTGENISILEIGCGTGQYYNAWKALGVTWQGLEVNKEMLKFCGDENIPVRNIDIMTHDFKEQYDVVFLSQVLEHIISPNVFLEKIKKNIKKGGILHIDVPNHDSISSLYRRINIFHPQYGFLQPNHHLIAYNEKSLSYLLKKNDFSIKEIGGHNNDHEVFGQLIVKKSLLSRMFFLLSKITKRGSLLVAVATIE